MNAQDQQAIDQVFTRLEAVAREAGPRDAEAEALIHDRLRAQPGSAYFLAQTVVVQQQALENAQRRIQALEQQGRQRAAPVPASVAQPAPQASANAGFGRSALSGGVGQAAPAQTQQPLSASGFGRSAGGGGFLAGAAQTALGVAGGMMLGSLLGGMFGGNDAQAAEPAAADPSAADPDATAFTDEPATWDDGADMDMGEF